jgi:biopolymer transport protein ExbD
MAMGPISRRGGNGRRAPMADINVTPLVDVMLVLLIIFMITAPLLVAGVPVNCRTAAPPRSTSRTSRCKSRWMRRAGSSWTRMR